METRLRIIPALVLVSLLILTLPRFGFPVQSVALADESISSTTQSSSLVELLQQISQTNDCDESGNGNNNATCTDSGSNAVGPITQTNQGFADNNDGDVNYENAVDIDQEVSQLNDCDEEDDGNDVSTCINEASSSIGSINQRDPSSGINDVDMSQRINQENDCDEFGGGNNRVTCMNEGNNAVGPITQTNSGHSNNNNNGDSSSENEIHVDQDVNQLNDCDEEDDGNNVATCTDAAKNTVGSITQTNQGSETSNNGDTNYENAVDVDQQSTQENDCDEGGDGDNNAQCDNQASNSVGDIIQTNDGENKNDVDIDQKTNQRNDCDEGGDGDNNAQCDNQASNSVGDISQSEGNGGIDDEVNENASSEDDENDDGEDDNNGDSDERDSDIDQHVSQENGCSGNCNNDGSNSVTSTDEE
jgi:hypothetical protein